MILSRFLMKQVKVRHLILPALVLGLGAFLSTKKGQEYVSNTEKKVKEWGEAIMAISALQKEQAEPSVEEPEKASQNQI